MKWLGEPTRFTDLSRSEVGEIIPIRRFMTHQKDKSRPIDSCRRAGANLASSVEAPITLPSADDVGEVGLRLLENNQDPASIKCDHEDAFKQIPLNPRDSGMFRIVLRPPVDSSLNLFPTRR